MIEINTSNIGGTATPGTVLLFLVHKSLHLEPATVAMLGATVLLLVTTQPLERAQSEIQWSTLFFLIGLMVGALEETGAIGEIADGVADLTAEIGPPS